MKLNEWIQNCERDKTQVVFTEYVANKILDNQFGIKFFDSRDAAFFALGKSDLNSFVVCIMDESELSSAYTAIVEGCMRHKTFAIIVIQHTNKDINTSFLRHYNIPVFDENELYSSDIPKNIDVPYIIKCALDNMENTNDLS